MTSMDLNDGIPDDGELVIADETMALSIMRRLAEVEDEQADHATAARAQHDLIDEWLDRTNAPLAAKATRYETALKAYALARREATAHRAKKDQQMRVTTPWGDVTTRKGQDKWTVTDDTLAIKSARALGLSHLVLTETTTTEKFVTSAAKELAKKKPEEGGLIVSVEGVFDANGTAIEGITFTPATVSASVKLAGRKS